MSITRTLDGKLSATLAMLTIVGWLVVAIVDMYRLGIFPDVATVALVLGLAVTAYKFYSEDKQSSKDPETQKAQIEASTEMYLDKLAKYQAEINSVPSSDNPLESFLMWLNSLSKEEKTVVEDAAAQVKEDFEFDE